MIGEILKQIGWFLGVLLVWLVLAIGIMLLASNIAQASPPHPSKHYKWEVLPTSQVILYYLVNGQYSRYVYKMVHEVEPAVKCTHSYGPKSFRLITFDTTHPYWYTIYYEPEMKWNSGTKKYEEIK